MRGMNTFSASLFGVLLFVTAASAPAQNPAKGKGQSTQQAKQELDAAKDKLKDANADLNKAEKDLDKAKTAHTAAEAKIQKARAAAMAEHGKKLGLPTAIAQRDAALRSVEAAQTALSKEFRAQADYQAAAKEAEQASARLQSLRDDTALSAEKKQQLTAELSRPSAAPPSWNVSGSKPTPGSGRFGPRRPKPDGRWPLCKPRRRRPPKRTLM